MNVNSGATARGRASLYPFATRPTIPEKSRPQTASRTREEAMRTSLGLKIAPSRRETHYHEVYRRSIEDPAGFWGEAAQEIDWYEEPQKIFDRVDSCA